MKLDKEPSEDILFFLNIDGSDPKIDKYDLKMAAGKVKVDLDMLSKKSGKPRFLRFLAYSELRISVIANLRFSYPQKNSQVFQKGSIFSPQQELYIAQKLGYAKIRDSKHSGKSGSKLKIISKIFKKNSEKKK